MRSTFTNAIVVGIVAFVLISVVLLEQYQPFIPGKPLPPFVWNFDRMIRLVTALIIAVLGALYVYKYGEYTPPYSRDKQG